MTPKEYLLEIQRYKRIAKSLSDQVDTLRHEIGGLKAITYDRDHVQVSPSNRMEKMMPKLIKLEEKYLALIAKYHAETLKRSKQIAEMPTVEYSEILRLRYIETNKKGERYSLKEIALITHRSEGRVRHMHGEALREFGRVYLKKR